MNNIVSIFGKGGAGKSTTAFLLVDFFSRMKNVNVLLIDLDKQNTISSALLGREKIEEEKVKGKCFTSYIKNLQHNDSCEMYDYLHTSKATGVDVFFVNGDKTLGVENYLKHDDIVNMVGKLKNALTKRYDLVIIDTPPNIDSRNTIPILGHLLSDLIITPVELSDFAVDALKGVFKTINEIKSNYSGFTLNTGVLINKIYRNNVCKEKIKLIEDMANNNSAFIFSEKIPYSSILKIKFIGSKNESVKKRYSSIYGKVHHFIIEIAMKIKSIVASENKVVYATSNAYIGDSSFTDSLSRKKCHICGAPAISGDNICYTCL